MKGRVYRNVADPRKNLSIIILGKVVLFFVYHIGYTFYIGFVICVKAEHAIWYINSAQKLRCKKFVILIKIFAFDKFFADRRACLVFADFKRNDVLRAEALFGTAEYNGGLTAVDTVGSKLDIIDDKLGSAALAGINIDVHEFVRDIVFL